MPNHVLCILHPTFNYFDTSGDICTYWHKVLQLQDGRGGKTYECLAYVAHAALTLSHSNAIPERGFSVNNAMLGKEKLLLRENTIVALLIVKDTFRLFGSSYSCKIGSLGVSVIFGRTATSESS